jgi:hypothetical protein
LRSPIYTLWKTSGDNRLRPALPSTRVLLTPMLQMVGGTTMSTTPAVLEGWSFRSKVMGVPDHLRGCEPPGAGDAAQTSL